MNDKFFEDYFLKEKKKFFFNHINLIFCNFTNLIILLLLDNKKER